jgi:hypothetical protein
LSLGNDLRQIFAKMKWVAAGPRTASGERVSPAE